MDGGAVGGITVEDDNLTDEIIDIEALECMLATGTVICMGPLTAISGVYTEFRMEPFELDTPLLMVSLVSEGTEGEVPNPEFEDWRRVLTTSKGHVNIAPIVPPILERKFFRLHKTQNCF